MTQPRKRSAGATSPGAAARKRTSGSSGSAARNGRDRTPSPAQIARSAAEQLTEIMGVEADSISGLERSEEGWLVRVEVVEVARIPDSTSVLASYQVVLDRDGALQSYRREQRYYRNQAGDS